MKVIYKFIKFFELYMGWFFVNGYKREAYQKYLTKKYKQ